MFLPVHCLVQCGILMCILYIYFVLSSSQALVVQLLRCANRGSYLLSTVIVYMMSSHKRMSSLRMESRLVLFPEKFKWPLIQYVSTYEWFFCSFVLTFPVVQLKGLSRTPQMQKLFALSSLAFHSYDSGY